MSLYSVQLINSTGVANVFTIGAHGSPPPPTDLCRPFKNHNSSQPPDQLMYCCFPLRFADSTSRIPRVIAKLTVQFHFLIICGVQLLGARCCGVGVFLWQAINSSRLFSSLQRENENKYNSLVRERFSARIAAGFRLPCCAKHPEELGRAVLCAR